MTNSENFDVFLCHNSKEKEEVEKIREQLHERGIYTFLDKYDFVPFRPWQDQLEEIISKTKVAAIFIGSSGVGPWANIEMKEFIVKFAQRGIYMGLVILPGCPEEVIDTVPTFINSFHRVDFRQQDPDPLEQLIWGITGKKPSQPQPKSIQTSPAIDSSKTYIRPQEYRTLLGRETEIEDIKEALSQDRRKKIIGVDGFGGVGKTALVQEIVKSYDKIGFNKVLWKTASTTDDLDQMTFDTVLDTIAKQLNRPGLSKEKGEEREVEIRNLLHEKPVLIVLDDMENSAEPQEDIIKKLLPIMGDSKALLTSRTRFTEVFGDNLFPIHLRGLTEEAAINLMEDTATQKNLLTDFKAVNENQLNEMIRVTGDEHFGYTPMALKFILGQLQKFDPKVIIEGLEGVRITDTTTSEEDEFKQFWKQIFIKSFQLLSDIDRRFMTGMTLFEANIGSGYDQIKSTIKLNNEEFRKAVNSTWKVSFLEIAQRDASKTYYLHRLSYTFFQAILAYSSQR